MPVPESDLQSAQRKLDSLACERTHWLLEPKHADLTSEM